MIHIGHKLLEEEVKDVDKRRLTVQECLKIKGIHCTGEEICKQLNVALIGSGGGARAMVGLLGSICQLKKEGLLDCITYLSGVSGSTWCMASLYKEENWSDKLESVADGIVKRLSGPKVSWTAAVEKLKKYHDETDNYSLTHFWSAFAVTTWVKEIDETCLSAQKGKHPKDPIPIFTVIDKGMKQQDPQTTTLLKDTWVEMTIPTVGYTLAGAFVDQASFGSKFDNGSLMKDQKEMDMLYIQGLCSSVLADGPELKKILLKKIKDALGILVHPLSQECGCKACELLQYLVEINFLASEVEDYEMWIPKINKLLEDKKDKWGMKVVLQQGSAEGRALPEEELKRFNLTVCECFSEWYPEEHPECDGFLKYGKIFYDTMSCFSNWKWGTTYDFLYKMQLQDDSVDPGLLATTTRDYIDAGPKLNSPYFSVLRPERRIDLIISLDFSEGDPMLTVKEAHTMANNLGIAFPTVNYPEDANEKPADFYVFKPKDQKDTKTPTVIHMPLFNTANCGADLEKMRTKYKTWQLGAYSHEMITELMEKAAENVKNTKDRLWQEIEARAKRMPKTFS